MVSSMTAFAREAKANQAASVVWELKSVNHRFLEFSFRLPEVYRGLELELRELAKAKIHRGKLECNLYFQPGDANPTTLQLNNGLVTQLLEVQQQLLLKTNEARALTIADLLRWPGVLQIVDTDQTELKQMILTCFEQALEQLLEVRQREGKALVGLLQQRLQVIEKQIEETRAALPEILLVQEQRLTERFAQAAVECDPERLEQEMVLLAQKYDVLEEVERLATHHREMQRILSKQSPIGRQLDFLLQEMNREANTIGSKSIATVTSHLAVEMKVLIEQMREQVQNIE